MAARRKRPVGRKRPRRPKAEGSGKAAAASSQRRAPRRVAAAHAVEVGRVVHYFPAAGTAELALEGPIRRGDTLHLRGHTTDLLQPVESLRRAGARIQKAGASESVTLAVAERVRPGDRVYRLDFPADEEPVA